MAEYLTQTGLAGGYVVDAQTMYEMSKDWYAGRMDEEWEPKTADEAEAVFHAHGLAGDFWRLTGADN